MSRPDFHSARASHEEGLLACLITHPEYVAGAIGESPVPLPELFTGHLNRKLMETIISLFDEGQSMSINSILARAQETGVVATPEDMYDFYDRYTGGRSNYDSHIWPLVAFGKANRIVTTSSRVAEGPQNGEPVSHWVETASADLLDMVLSLEEDRSSTYNGSALAALSEEEIIYVPTGFNSLDIGIGGLHPGRVNIVAARPSHGKTAFCLEMAYRIASRPGHKVLYFSAEMSEEQIARRYASRIKASGVNTDVHATLSSLGIIIDPNPSPTTTDIMGRAVQVATADRLDLIVFDYLEYSGEQAASEVLRFQNALRGCHRIAKRIGCPFVVVTQMNRKIDSRGDLAKPKLTDLEYGGEKIASLVLMLQNEFVQWNQAGRPPEYEDELDPNALDLFVRKNTHGPMASITLQFDRESGWIRD